MGIVQIANWNEFLFSVQHVAAIVSTDLLERYFQLQNWPLEVPSG